jgi:hypothetical protein
MCRSTTTIRGPSVAKLQLGVAYALVDLMDEDQVHIECAGYRMNLMTLQ